MAKGVYVGKSRSPLLVLLFGLVTVFVYSFFWMYAANLEMQKRGVKGARPGLYVFLALFPIIQVFAVHRTIANLRKIYLANNVARDPSPWAWAVLCLPLPYFGLLFMSASAQRGLNHVWEATRAAVVEDGPEEKELQCPSCDAVFEIRKNPYTESAVQCPECRFEGVV